MMNKCRAAVLAVLALFVCAAPAQAAYSVIATLTSVAGDNTTLDSTGADLAVMVTSEAGGVSSCSDTKSNSWTTSLTRYSTSPYYVMICYSRLTSTGSGHGFFTTGEQFGVTSIVLLSGSAASPFDQESGSAGTAATRQPGSLTPSQDNCIVVVGYAADSSGESINGGFTRAHTDLVGGVNIQGGIAYLIQTTATAANPTLTLGASGQSAMAMAVFKASAGGGGGAAAPAGRLLLGVGK